MYNSSNYMYNQMPMMSQQPFNPFFPFPQNRSVIDAGSALKSRTGELTIQFNRRFSSPPIVIVTSYWRGQGSQVTFVDTITRVNRNGFTVVSDNAANNYYVNWVAILPE